jgi:hypothetical protein
MCVCCCKPIIIEEPLQCFSWTTPVGLPAPLTQPTVALLLRTYFDCKAKGQYKAQLHGVVSGCNRAAATVAASRAGGGMQISPGNVSVLGSLTDR